MIKRIEKEIINKVLGNGGRWCDLNMKDGNVLKVVRTGYRSFEDFDRDTCKLVDSDDNILINAKTPYDIAVFIYNNYCK